MFLVPALQSRCVWDPLGGQGLRIPTSLRSQLFSSKHPRVWKSRKRQAGAVLFLAEVDVQQTHPRLLPSGSLIINPELWGSQGLLSFINSSSELRQAVLRCWQGWICGMEPLPVLLLLPGRRFPLQHTFVTGRKIPLQAQPRRINSKRFNSPLEQ